MATTITSTGPSQAIGIFGSFLSSTTGGVYYIVEQVARTIAIGRLLVLGSISVPTTKSSGTFSDLVSLPAGTYTLGATGGTGDILRRQRQFCWPDPEFGISQPLLTLP